MKPDDFESELQRHTVRPLPEEWRKEILTAANARGSKADWLKVFRLAIGIVPTPNRRSWSAIAAAWVVILLLQTNTSEPERPKERTSHIEQAAIHFGEQRKLLFEILNGFPSQVADKPALKRPALRSQPGRNLILA